MDKRIQELLNLATQEDIQLSYPPEIIVAMENTGAVVGLITGAILIGEADQPYTWELTAQGKAVGAMLNEH